MVRGSSQVVVVPVGTKRPIEKKPDLKVRTSQPGAKADGAKLGHKGGTHSQRTTEPKSGLSKAVPKKPQDVVGAKVKDADKSLTKSAATKGIEKAPGTKQPTGEPAAKDLKALAPGAVSNKQESNRGVTRSAQGKENQATDTRAKAPAADKAGSRTGDAARSTRAQAESTKAVSDRDPKVSLAPTSAKDTPVKSLGNKGSAATDSKEAGLLKREKEAGTFSKLAERVKSGEATSVEKVVYEVGKFVKGLFGFKDMSEAPLDPTSTQQVLHLEENADVDSDSLLDSEEKVELEEQESDISEVAGVFNIRGRVVEFASARPLPGVTLSLGGFGSATTDNQGEYVFENVLAGTAYTLSIEEGAYDFLPSSVSGVLTGYANHHFFGKVRLH
jgi:hypothetical protein